MSNKNFTLVQHNLPAYWASYLINADASGLAPGEQAIIEAFCAPRGLEGLAVDCGESFFYHRNDANTLGGDVCQFSFLVPRQVESSPSKL